MSVLLAKANGNFTAASTWGLVDPTSYLNAEYGVESLLTTSYSGTRSAAFTPGAIQIDGIAVKLCEVMGSTGTISVHLELDSDNSEVAGTEVTINVADLPSVTEVKADGGWIFFKFASPVTLLAATAYQVAAKTSSANQVDLWCDTTADNLSRCLRTTTEQAPVAGDDLIVTGEKTGAGTENTITVTMNETATTDYGSASTSLITPAIAICDGGTLQYGTSAATNYYLKVSGNIIVYNGGTFNVGTTGTAIPRDSTAVLEFDCGSDGDFGVTVRDQGVFNAQGLSRTSGKNVIACLLNTDEAANSTSLGVDTDTGWLDNDEIVVVSTSRTPGECEKGTLNGNAGASSLTVDGFAGAGGGLAYSHLGTSPAQGEIVLITRNVKFRSATSGVMFYIDIKSGGTIDFDWVEIRYVGTKTSPKYGLYFETGAIFDVQYCTVYDTDFGGVSFSSGLTSGNFSNNVLYNIQTQGTSTDYAGINLYGTITCNNNYFIYVKFGTSTTGATGGGIQIGASTVQFNGNTIAGAYAAATFPGLGINVGSLSEFPEISGLVVHSCQGYGVGFCHSTSSYCRNANFSNWSIWRNGAEGVRFSKSYGSSISSIRLANLIFDTINLFGNTNANLSFEGQSTSVYSFFNNIIFKNLLSNGDSSFSTTDGIKATYCQLSDCKILTGNFSTASGILTAHTVDLDPNTNPIFFEIVMVNVILAASTELANISYLMGKSLVKSQKHDQTAGSHKSWLNYGTIQTDTTIYKTASPSEKLTPSDATYKLESGSKKVAVESGQTVTISAFVRESVVGDGTDYGGNRPRLILKANPAIGINSDTVIDTATVLSEGAFEELTGTTDAATDDGVMEFVVDCDGTTGWVNVDDWSVT